MRSIAAIITSSVTEPSQPKTRYAPKVTSGATPVACRLAVAVGADDAGDVRPVPVAVVRDGVGLGTGL